MARKSKRKNGSSVVDKASIIAALEDRSKQDLKKKRKVNKKEPKIKSKTLSAALVDVNLVKQYEGLFKKFNELEEDERKSMMEKSNHRGTKRTLEEESREESRPVDKVGEDDQDKEEKLSKKKLRLMNKPTLAELKGSVALPQLIEKYDCDAKDPYFLAAIKTSLNVVQVPSHWQAKRDYLSGRSLLSKKPFELPDIIRQTGIESMRSTLPEESADSDDPKLKEKARATVRPKLGKLDLDYKRLYDTFFKLGANWKPTVLLPFGDMYYENRNLSGEAKWRKMMQERIPGRLSEELRNALGLKDGQLPPWCLKMKDNGMPPSYPTMKVAGLNWDITNFKNNKYGKLSRTENYNSKQDQLFGSIIVFDDKQEESEEFEEENKDTVQEKIEYKDEKIDHIIFEPEKTENEENVEPKELYKVLEESSDGKSKYYKINDTPDAVKESSAPTESSANPISDEDNIDAYKF
ncbi:hypothetical protein RNJ44_00657 [Nakaseomyces bracarensis]|uniref:PSP proline-rich domain-containing protein n=1 Tax=Nakaseomyces bracarensis TaxID=273131 RepID=A0ABR4NRP8_9SACH